MKKAQGKLHLLAMLALVFGMLLIPGKASQAREAGEIQTNNTWVSYPYNTHEEEIWWSFVVPEDGRVDFTFQSFRDYTTYSLYDSEQVDRYFYEKINEGSSTLPGSREKTCWLKAGVYRIMAKDNSYSYAGDGDVCVKINFTSAKTTEIEPNDDWIHAMQLPSGEKVRGVLTDIDDRNDFYVIQADRSGDIAFTLTSMFNYARLELYSDGYKELQHWHLNSASEASPLVGEWTYEGIEPGTYYLKITDNELTSDPSGIYELRWDMKEQVIPVSSLTLSPESLTLEEGNTAVIAASVLPLNATNQTLEWKSSNTAVAAVAQDGTVTAGKAGKAFIYVSTTDGSKLTKQCSVTVEAKKTEPDPGTGQEPGTGSDPGTGQEPGTGSDPGTGQEPGTGSDSGTEKEPGTGSDSGTEKEPGTGADSGTEKEPGTGSEPETEIDTPPVDTTAIYTYQNLKYKIISVPDKTAQVVGMVNAKKSEAVIPSAAKIAGAKYKVVQIGAGAFANAKVRTVEIGKYVQIIDKKAFKGCTRLAQINVKSKKLTKVGTNALKQTKAKIRIIIPKKYYSKYKTLFTNKGQKKINFVKW